VLTKDDYHQLALLCYETIIYYCRKQKMEPITPTADTSKCAECGQGEENLKTCTACKLVKYCNASCQKAHRPMHKKECKKRAAELHDEALFKQPPPRGECPICMLPLPIFGEGGVSTVTYQSCCGKTICNGCIYGMEGGKYVINNWICM